MLGKSKQHRMSPGNGGENTNENQIFNSSGISMNHIDLEADIDLNL